MGLQAKPDRARPASDVVRIGVLGAARIAPMAMVLPAREVANAAVTAVAARSRDRAQTFAARFDIPRVACGYEDLIFHEDVDAIYVALPAALHDQWITAALGAGKHVLCEKPLTTSAPVARDLVSLAAQSGLQLVEAYHYRYHPYFHRVVDLIKDVVGEIQAVDVVHSNYVPRHWPVYWDPVLGGGALLHLGGYAVHAVRALTAWPPEVVDATATRIDGVDATVVAQLRLGNDAPVRIRTSMTDPKGYENWLWVRGSEAELHASNFIVPHLATTDPMYASEVRVRPRDGRVTAERAVSTPSYTFQLEAFVAAVNSGDQLPTSGLDVIETLRTIDGIRDAAGTGTYAQGFRPERRKGTMRE